MTQKTHKMVLRLEQEIAGHAEGSTEWHVLCDAVNILLAEDSRTDSGMVPDSCKMLPLKQ